MGQSGGCDVPDWWTKTLYGRKSLEGGGYFLTSLAGLSDRVQMIVF